MKNLAQHLKEDYERCKEQIPNTEDFLSPLLGYNDVLKAHYLICDYFESTKHTASVFGVRDMNLLGSAIGRQRTEYDGQNKWVDEFEIMATLFFGLTKNHAFRDGNKRTALLCLLYQLHKYGRVPSANQNLLERLTVDVADGSIKTRNNFKEYLKKYGKHMIDSSEEDKVVYYISYYIKKYSRKLDSSYRALTYEEFNTVLRRLGAYLDNPQKNCINVYDSSGRRVKQIGFPGWKKQIYPKAFKETLKALHFTPENGYDYSVFMEDAEPLYKIIQDYERPLSRLKDK